MTEYIDIKELSVTDGILHDQELTGIHLVDDELLMVFDNIEWFPDYEENNYALKYKDYTKCAVKLKVSEYKDENTVDLYTALKSNGLFKGIELSLSDFINLMNDHKIRLVYLGTIASDNNTVINLSFYAKKGKYKKYCTAEIHTRTDRIEFFWE